MQRQIAPGFVVLSLALSCSRAPATPAQPDAGVIRPLAGFAAQRVIVVPAGAVRAPDSLSWVARLGGTRAVARRLDTLLLRTFDARGLTQRWIMPAELSRAYERNRGYASDPYLLVWDPVRSPRFKTGERYGEPLSSQLRTMIALHDDARFILLPIELRFEREGATGRAVLRAALVDARTTEGRWVGELKSDPADDPMSALNGVAARLADLFVAP